MKCEEYNQYNILVSNIAVPIITAQQNTVEVFQNWSFEIGADSYCSICQNMIQLISAEQSQ